MDTAGCDKGHLDYGSRTCPGASSDSGCRTPMTNSPVPSTGQCEEQSQTQHFGVQIELIFKVKLCSSL